MTVRCRFVLVSCLVAGIAGCSAPAEQGPAPTTVQECRDDYDAAKQRIREAGNAQSYSGGNALGTSIGAGYLKGLYERRFQECLVAVGGGSSYNQGQSSNARSSQPRTVNGKYSLPTLYPLMAGDSEIWGSLTATEQERALQFLKNGSTIRSSLSGDE